MKLLRRSLRALVTTMASMASIPSVAQIAAVAPAHPPAAGLSVFARASALRIELLPREWRGNAFDLR